MDVMRKRFNFLAIAAGTNARTQKQFYNVGAITSFNGKELSSILVSARSAGQAVYAVKYPRTIKKLGNEVVN